MADTSGSRRHVLWMGPIPRGTTKQDVKKYFKHYNIPIKSTVIPHDSMTGQSLGFAYVIFASEEDMRSARERANYGHIQNLDVLLHPVERDPTLRRSGQGNLYVRGFPEDGMTPREIHNAFSSFGPVFSVRRPKRADGQYVPFGYVRFENREDAQACLQAAQEKTGIFAEMDMIVESYRTKQDRSTDTQNRDLYFRGFSDTLSEADIRAHFAAHGSIDSFTIRTSDDHDARFGFCSFMTHEDAAKARSALHGSVIGGSPVAVNWFSSRRRHDTPLSDEARRPDIPFVRDYLPSLIQQTTVELGTDMPISATPLTQFPMPYRTAPLQEMPPQVDPEAAFRAALEGVDDPLAQLLNVI